MRLFIALPISDEVRGELREKITALPHSSKVKWVAPSNWHLTLHFLGETSEGKLPEIRAALERTASRHSAFQLRLERAGTFGKRDQKVFWIGVSGESDAVVRLAANVQDELAPLGFPKEERDFHPHLTVGRGSLPSAEFDTLFAAFQSHMFDATVIELIRSHLSPQGSTYETLASFPLRTR